MMEKSLDLRLLADHYFVVKHSGSMGVVYDMSNTELMVGSRMIETCAQYGCASGSEIIRYKGYDSRIKLHAWQVLAYLPNYDHKSHIMWVYSYSPDVPYLDVEE